MAKFYTNDGPYIAEAMKDHLNSWPKKPCEIRLEDLDKDGVSMMLQQLASAEKRKTYIDGSYLGVWPFAVYIHIQAEDTASRLDATGCLWELAEWLRTKDAKGEYVNLPSFDEQRQATRIELTNTPSIAARYEDDSEDYQALFELEYTYHRR